jgi:hypothetical protein
MSTGWDTDTSQVPSAQASRCVPSAAVGGGDGAAVVVAGAVGGADDGVVVAVVVGAVVVELSEPQAATKKTAARIAHPIGRRGRGIDGESAFHHAILDSLSSAPASGIRQAVDLPDA